MDGVMHAYYFLVSVFFTAHLLWKKTEGLRALLVHRF